MSTDRPRYGMDCTTHRPIAHVDVAATDYGNAVTWASPDEVARRIAAMHDQLLPIATPREYPRIGGWRLHAAAQDESLADMMARAPLWPEPGYDMFGLPAPEADRLFWEWANWSPPVRDPALTDCPHTATATPPPAEPAPTPQQSINDTIAEAIAWSREQQRRDLPPATVTIGGRTYTQRQLDERYLELREFALGQLDHVVRGRMYEGRFSAPESQEEADEWEQRRLDRLRRQG